jgi:vacuolar-type H+-ATPase subunit H
VDKIIRELISYDHQARTILQEARQAKEKAEKELPEEEEKLYHDYLQRAKERTNRIQEQMEGSNRDDIAKMEESYRQESERLEGVYQANREKWIEELYSRCIGVPAEVERRTQ